MADETTEVPVSTKTSIYNKTSVCVWKHNLHGHEVCEEFLGYCSMPVANAEAIKSAIVGLVEGAGPLLA